MIRKSTQEAIRNPMATTLDSEYIIQLIESCQKNQVIAQPVCIPSSHKINTALLIDLIYNTSYGFMCEMKSQFLEGANENDDHKMEKQIVSNIFKYLKENQCIGRISLIPLTSDLIGITGQMAPFPLDDDELRSRLCAIISKNLGYHIVNLWQEHILVIESGEKYKPTKLDPTILGRVVIVLPSQYTGGEFLINQTSDIITSSTLVDLSHFSSGYNWIAIFGNCLQETNYVTSGTQILLTYLIKLNPLQVSPHYQLKEYDNNPIFKGYTDSKVQRHHIRHLLDHLIRFPPSSFGWILPERYLEGSLTPNILKGTDKLLVEALQKAGCTCFIVPVLMHQTSKEIDARVCFLSDPSQNTPRFCSYPFYYSNFFRYLKPKDPNCDIMFCYEVALIVELPPWSRQRILILAKKKNDKTCVLYLLFLGRFWITYGCL